MGSGQKWWGVLLVTPFIIQSNVFCKNTAALHICYTCQSCINRQCFYHVYGILLVLHLPLTHRIGQAPPLWNQDRQRAPHNHSHSQLLLPLQRSGKLTQVESLVLTLTAIHSRSVLGSCCHQTEHASTGLWVLILLSVGHHILPEGVGMKQVSSMKFNRSKFNFNVI